jgi:Flp pilus assembly protein TadD
VSGAAAAPGASRLPVAVGAALVLVTAVAFRGVLDLPFIGFDDPEYVTQNPDVAGGLTLRSAAWAMTTGRAANWHPVTWLSHMLDASLFGLDPRGHHATSLVLHCANAALLFVLLLRMTGATWRSALAAALFALHPLRVESVAWVSERKDVLAAAFWLATTLAYVARTRAPSRRRYALAAVLLALGLASKQMLVTLPFTLLLLDAWPLRRIDLAHPTAAAAWPLVREKLPLFALAGAAAVAALVAQSSWGSTRPLAGVPLADRAGNAVVSIAAYAGKEVWPASLAVFYPYPSSPPAALAVLGILAALGVAAALAWRVRASRPSVPVGLLWFAGTLVPVLGLVQVGNQAMADRYTYVPAIGLSLAVAWTIPAPSRRAAALALAGVAAAAVALLAALTVRQVGFWRSERSLFEHAAAVTERNWLAETAIGMDLERRGDVPGAVERYERAVAWNPRAPEALNNLGNALVGRGETARGIAYLREAVRLWPGYVSALGNLGAALAETGRAGEALPYLAEAVERAPAQASARYNLGLALLDLGRPVEALVQFEAVLALDPADADARAQVARLGSQGPR